MENTGSGMGLVLRSPVVLDASQGDGGGGTPPLSSGQCDMVGSRIGGEYRDGSSSQITCSARC